MNVGLWLRTFLIMPLVAGGLLVQLAAGQDGPSGRDGLDGGPGATTLDRFFLDVTAKDPGFTLATPGQATLWFPLTSGDWSLFRGMRPYATFSPSTVKPITGAEPGLAAPVLEPSDDSWKGLGLGAGLQWRLSDRLDLFGRYQFLSLPGGNAPTGSPFMRRETENPGVRAGLSIHF